MSRAQALTAGQDRGALRDVPSGRAHRGPRLHRHQNPHLVFSDRFGVLYLDHSVGTRGHRGARHDLDGRPLAHLPCGHATRCDLFDDGQRHRCSRHVGGAHREAIHRRVGERGKIVVGNNVCSQHQAECLA